MKERFMNKSQLVAMIAEATDLTSSKAEKMLGVTLEAIVDTLTKGGSISLIGFGNFGVKTRAARKVRNPQTGKEMMIKAALVPFFKAGKGLKDQVATTEK
jgi:DNA-binding protein HU-beta